LQRSGGVYEFHGVLERLKQGTAHRAEIFEVAVSLHRLLALEAELRKYASEVDRIFSPDRVSDELGAVSPRVLSEAGFETVLAATPKIMLRMRDLAFEVQ